MAFLLRWLRWWRNDSDSRSDSDSDSRSDPESGGGLLPEVRIRFISDEQKEVLKTLEKRREDLCEKERILTKEYNEAAVFLVNNISVYVMMVGGGLFIGVYLHKRTHAYVMVALLMMTYIAGVTAAIWSTYKMLELSRWSFYLAREERRALLARVEQFARSIDATPSPPPASEIPPPPASGITVKFVKTRLEEMANSLRGTVRFQTTFLVATSLACLLYIIAIAFWIMFTIRENGYVFFGKAAGGLAVLTAT